MEKEAQRKIINVPEPTPRPEINRRISQLQEEMEARGIHCVVLNHGPDLYYFTGTCQAGHLFVPANGPPCYYVWRSFERARVESGIDDLKKISNLSALKEQVQKDGFARLDTVAIPMDVCPANLYLFYTSEIFEHARFVDAGHIIRIVRAKKSPWEIQQIRSACEIIDHAMDRAARSIHEGMGELELASLVESAMREKGHIGFIRMRGTYGALGMSQVLTGPHGALPSFTLTPAGGPGPSPAFGVGSGFRRIHSHEPISIDLGGCFNGYYGDETRPFAIGAFPSEMEKGIEAVTGLMGLLERELRPGVTSGYLYDIALDFMEEKGLSRFFMGYSEKVHFIGHGLGVEINEYPFISRGNDMPLEEGMVLALEPKLIYPDLGLVGIEDTFLIEDASARRLTSSPRIFIL